MDSSEQNQNNKEKKIEPKPVSINVNKTQASPHVVDLREEEPDLEEITAFREKMKEQRERKTVDFAEMIKKANEKSLHKEEDVLINHDNPASVQVDSEFDTAKKQKFPETKSQKTTGKIGTESSDFEDNPLKEEKIEKNQIVKSINALFEQLSTFYKQSTNLNPLQTLEQEVQRQKKLAQTFFQDLTKRRAFASVLLLIAVLFLPFPVAGYYNKIKQDSRDIIEKSTQGFSALSSSSAALFSSDIEKAKYDLNTALNAFDQAQSIIEKDYKFTANAVSLLPVIGDNVSARKHLLTAGHHLTLGNTYLVKGVSDAKEKTDLPLTERLEIIQNHLQSSVPQYEQALRSLAAVSEEDIPKQYREVSKNFKLLFAAMIDDMKDITGLVDAVQMIFGQEGYHKYLVVFQNSNELRPLGGFAGSYAVVEVQKGEVSWEIPSGGTYDLQGQMNLRLKPPVPLQMVNKKWEFQDANWWSHLPASAAVMEDMYKEARGSSIDGVITVNSDVLERIVEVTGPIKSEQFDQPLTKKNILRKIQQSEEEIEQNSNKKPKAILSRLSDKLMEKVKSGKKIDLLHLAVEAYQALNEKQIQVYMEDNKTQETLRSFGWTGEILPANPKQDYLHLVHANLQGQKSNAKIDEKLKLKTSIKSDGSIVNKLMINRTHTADPTHPVYGATNFSHIRAYVPKGSKLVETNGFEFPPEEAFRAPEDNYRTHPTLKELVKNEKFNKKTGAKISQQFGKTVFSHWLVTKPGETSKAYIKYKLPFKLKQKRKVASNVDRWKQIFLNNDKPKNISYSMFIQKQAGTEYPFTQEVSVSKQWRPVWKSTKKVQFKDDKIKFGKELSTDTQYGFLLEQIN